MSFMLAILCWVLLLVAGLVLMFAWMGAVFAGTVRLVRRFLVLTGLIMIVMARLITVILIVVVRVVLVWGAVVMLVAV